MNYTKTLREYCKTTPWKIFDVSYEMSERFKMVPYKTLLKVMNRLEEEGIVESISKGIFLIKNGDPVEDPIVAHYAGDGRGVVVGYTMYNKYKVTEHTQGPIEIYTNAMMTETKNIGDKYILMRFPVYFSKHAQRLVSALEILENGPDIIGTDLSKRALALKELLSDDYIDLVLSPIIKNHRYKYSTMVALSSVLSDLGIKNDVLNIYKKECL